MPLSNRRLGPSISPTSLIAILVLWVGLALLAAEKHGSIVKRAEAETATLSRAFEESVGRTMDAVDAIIHAIRSARALSPERFDLAAWVRSSRPTPGLALQISTADRTGLVTASSVGPVVPGTSIADREHFRAVRDGGQGALFISRPVVGRVSGRLSVQLVRPLADAAGAFDGVVVVSLDPVSLTQFHRTLPDDRSALIVVGQDGVVRGAAPSAALIGSDLSGAPLMRRIQAAPTGAARVTDDANGAEHMTSWRSLAAYPLTVVVASADIAGDHFWTGIGALVSVGLALTVAILVIGALLARNQRILQAAIGNLSQGLLVVDRRRRVRVLNNRAAELLGLPPHLTKPGVRFDDLLRWQLASGEFDRPEAAQVRTLAESGGLSLGDSVYQRTRSNGIALEIRTKVFASGFAVRTITDVTERQQAEAMLAKARDAAEAASRARSDFLAVMSHEVRTPLNGILGVAELLDGMELGPMQRDYVRLIRESGDHLLELLNDVLDVSRLDARRVELESVAFDPGALLRSTAELFRAKAGLKGLTLSAEVGEGVPGAVTGDPARLRQIMLNLVGNAIKFTDRGWVRLNLHATPLDATPLGEGRTRLRFTVADSGIGIAPEAVTRMFQDFTQMDASISRRYGGSGLGLAICRRLVELMGGTMSVDSAPGTGSCFGFDIVLPTAQDGPAPAAGDCPGRRDIGGRRVLLVEDNPTNRLVASRMLDQLGCLVETATTGAEALAALRRSAVDVVLMDIMMPEMDGLTATRLLRAAEKAGSRTPVIGLTAGARAEDLARCLEAGMDGVTTKPVTLARLRAAIEGALPPQAADAPSRLDELAAELGPDIVCELVDGFAQDARALLEALRSAAAASDHALLRRTAHSLAGAASNVGAVTLAAAARRIEHASDLSPAALHDAINAVAAGLHGAERMIETWRSTPVPAAV